MRISFESLGIDEWDEDVTDVHFEGSPFTGVAFHESSGGLTERAFADGKPHGRWFSTYADGSLAEESSYEHGKPAGQHREWDKSGQLRREISFGDSFSEKEWDRNGQLTMTFENGIRRRFYPGSSLPYCMVEKNEISFFARSGERAWHVVSQR